MSVVVAGRPARQRSLRGPAFLIGLASLIALAFFAAAAAPYFLSSGYNAQQYAGRRDALLVHIVFGTVALFSGPVQLWLGIADRRMEVHRRLGIIYMSAVTVSATAAYVIALSPSAGWVFGTGLMGLATAWLTTTGMAFLAIKRQLIEQHKEWMIRSYVVTFAFVFFRIGAVAFKAMAPAAELQEVAALAWACWALPLLFTEVIIQGRKIAAVRV
jgi:uncharacterized membrane protein YozB (DUF420 family)